MLDTFSKYYRNLGDLMKKILTNLDEFKNKQIPSVYSEGNWVNVDAWTNLAITYNESKVKEVPYYVFFSNDSLKLKNKVKNSEELYLVTAIHRGLEIFIMDYYYIGNIYNDRWSILNVMNKIKNEKELNQICDLRDTYFIHNLYTFSELGRLLVNCVNNIGPNKPLSYY